MIPSTSISNHPIGYALPADNYTVRLDSSKQENTYVAFVTDSVFMMFGREDADSIETDKFNWENGLLYETNDPGEKSVNFRTILVRYVSAQAQVLRVDAKRIAVGGDSAGGNLAAVVAITARDAGGPAICHQLLIYPATDQRFSYPSYARNGEGYLLTLPVMTYFRGHFLPKKDDWLDWRASPLLAKSLAGLPPAYVLTAGFDPLVDEGGAYADRLAKEGVEVAYREYPDMIHGFILFGGQVDTANAAVAECAAKLRAAFARKSA